MSSEPTSHTVKRPTRARDQLERILVLSAAGKSLTEICQETPISRSSLWRIRSTKEFQQRLQEIRQQAFTDAVSSLHSNALVFVTTLHGVCVDSKSRGSERATAARAGLDSLFKAVELFDHEQRLRAVEQHLAAQEAEK